jgi:predicted Rossmann fold flavoprotein
LHLCIIGGGPTGLLAAIQAAFTARQLALPVDITICERNQKAAKKLLVTGNGQCNLTRKATVEHMIDHYGDHGKFLRDALNFFSPEQTIEQFTTWGLQLITRDDNKVFPTSLKASDVLHTLLRQCDKQGVTIQYQCRIMHITYEKEQFLLETSMGNTLTADRVIVCTGGVSYPETGSTGDGYSLLKSLGHTLVSPRPSLCGITITDSSIGTCSGISLDPVTISFIDTTGKRRTAHGPLLITRTGFSGPVILHAVRHMVSGTVISVCWVPDPDGKIPAREDLHEQLKRRCTMHGKVQLSTLMHALGIPIHLAQWMLQELKIDGSKKAAETSKNDLRKIAQILSSQQFTISLHRAISRAMVTAGGVVLSQVDPKTMESKMVPRLFIAGELLDVDGDTGGYNLQAAWSTGALAGSSAVYSFTQDR